MVNNNIMFPDYNNSILNLITSILKYYGVESPYHTLPRLDEYLKHKYKNIVLLIMDGTGENVLTGASPHGVLNKNKIATITSVFPTTTTAAVATFYSGLPPIEHGRLAWSLYFKEYGRAIDLLPCTISANHGHNDIKEIYSIIDLKEIQECLIMPPFLETRLLSLFVKDNMKKEFEDRFNRLFKDKNLLYTKEKFLSSNLLGYGKKHRKIDDFIGDYIAISISDTIIKLGTYISKEKKDKKTTHCGLTRNEIEVPLIVYDLKG